MTPRAEMYQKAIKVLDEKVQSLDLKASCKPGCNHCCKNRVMVLPVEAAVIAEDILGRPDALFWVRKLEAASQGLEIGYANDETYFTYQVVCPFVDDDDGLCAIYNNRPVACRLHFVRTPPEDCAYDPKSKKTVESPNLIALEAIIWKLSEQMAVGLPTEYKIFSPLQLIVPKFLAIMATGVVPVPYDQNEIVQIALKLDHDLPTPVDWVSRYLYLNKGKINPVVVEALMDSGIFE